MQDFSAGKAVAAGATGQRERALDRMMQVLDFLHAHRRPVSPGTLARSIGAPRSTVYSLVKSLSEIGILETSRADGRVYFGRKLYVWGLDYLRENPLAQRGREAVDALSRETGETTEMCILQNGRYVILHMCPGERPFRISSAEGLQIPLPWTASGRLLLSDFPPAEADALMSEDDFVLPDGTRMVRDEFHAAIVEARNAGYAITSGLVDAFTKCMAAPVFGEDGMVAATLCFVVPKETPEPRVAELLDMLLARARALSGMA